MVQDVRLVHETDGPSSCEFQTCHLSIFVQHLWFVSEIQLYCQVTKAQGTSSWYQVHSLKHSCQSSTDKDKAEESTGGGGGRGANNVKIRQTFCRTVIKRKTKPNIIAVLKISLDIQVKVKT